ncbi:hypothetical protein [Paraburkholderia dioscoreae]|uniref:hypothetical protein n=1 Tax=Paraburkholderia dioscoreae TaxID=2604047 RepID=UPI0013EBC628|nr:hypothetical protein [Paraburkholderia dioscoreae]
MGDPARQAIASLRGYDYQIWRSVEAWMRLAKGQTLYLECAEDFDLVDDRGAESTQVKNSAKDISLGSSDVREAIENFWLLRERNPDRSALSMRFLTRGGIRFEKSKPFGREKGIEVWRLAAAGDDAAAPAVGRFFKAPFKTPALNEFLATASAAELRDQLLAHIHWITDEPDTEAVRLSVERLAVQLGSVRNITATASVAAVDGLLARCRETAAQSSPHLRSLTIEDKLVAFEAKTSLSVPMTHVALARLGNSLYSTGGGAVTSGAITFDPANLGIGPPPLPASTLPRLPLVEAIAQSLRAGHTVLIVGSEGRGKTTLANLVSRALDGADFWLDLSSLELSSLSATLERLLVQIRGVATRQVIVLDDVPVANGMEQGFWTRLSAVIGECSARSHVLLLTAQGVHPEAVDPRVRTAAIALHDVPDLSREEIAEFVASLGCPEPLRSSWAATILAQTGGGHPKLVHLRGLELRDEGWPAPSAATLATPPRSVEEAKRYARQEAARTLPDQDRELLYALSLALVPLDREAVLAIGYELANLAAPGDALDRLAGRWIELQGSAGYRVTALLTAQAVSAWPKAKIEQAHACLFDTIIRRRAISVDQALPMFMHAFQSADDGRFAHCLTGLASEDGKSRDIVYERIAPILFIARGKAASALSRFSARSLVLLKLLQFRVAQQQDLNQLTEIAHEWSEEIARLPDGQMRDGSRLLKAFLVGSATEGFFPASMLIEALEELVRLEHMIPASARSQGLPVDLSVGGREGAGDMIAALFMFMQARCDSIDFQDELLSALENADPAARSRMLKAFDIPFVRQNHLFVDRPWLAEAKRETPRWDFAVATLRRMIELATAWNCAALGAPAARVLALIYDEHLDNHDEAIACLRDATARFGEAPLLIAQEGNALFQRKRYKDALELWKKSLWRSGSPIDDRVRDPYSLRKAGIAAGLIGDYESASDWFEETGDLAREKEMRATAGGAWFDAAYCAFKNGAWPRTVALAYAGLDAFRNDFDPSDEFALFATKKLGGHILFWMLAQLRTSFVEDPAQPVLGQCSNPDRDKGIAELPSNSFDLSGAMLAEIASLLGVSSAETIALRAHIQETKIPAASYQYWSFRCNEAVESGQFEELAEMLMGLHRAHWASLAQRQSGASPLAAYTAPIEELDRTATLSAEAAFVAALWLRDLDGGSPQSLAARWAEKFSQSPDGKHLEAEAERALLAFSVDWQSARAVFFDRNAEFLARLGAVCRLLVGSSRDPALTARCQSVALLWLLQSAGRLTFDGMLAPIARHFAKMWRQHLSTPALLISPRIALPLLRDVTESKPNAPEQIMKLFDAAEIATGVAANGELRNELRKAMRAHAARIPW